MTYPTPEEIEQIAMECGLNIEFAYWCKPEQLQAFAQHWIEVGEKQRREKDAVLLWVKLMEWCKANNVHPSDMNSVFALCNAIRNNTGE